MKIIKITLLHNYAIVSTKDLVKLLKLANMEVVEGRLPGIKTVKKEKIYD